jgi:hypothetical protein
MHLSDDVFGFEIETAVSVILMDFPRGIIWGGGYFMALLFSHEMKLSPLGTAATDWPIVPVPDDR